MRVCVLFRIENWFPTENDHVSMEATLLNLCVGHKVLLGADDAHSAVWKHKFVENNPICDKEK